MFVTRARYDADLAEARKAAEIEADRKAVLEDVLVELADRLKRERTDNSAIWHLILALRAYLQ